MGVGGEERPGRRWALLRWAWWCWTGAWADRGGTRRCPSFRRRLLRPSRSLCPAPCGVPAGRFAFAGHGLLKERLPVVAQRSAETSPGRASGAPGASLPCGGQDGRSPPKARAEGEYPSPWGEPLCRGHALGATSQPLPPAHGVLHSEFGQPWLWGVACRRALSVRSCVGAQPRVTGADPRSWGDTAGLEKLTVMPLWERGAPPHPPHVPVPGESEELGAP